MGSFWILRWQAYRDVQKNRVARCIVLWDLTRTLVWGGFFALGLVLHSSFVGNDGEGASLRFMVGISAFGTFLASFVLSVMSATGKRELSLMPHASAVTQMEDRLRWLLSDQLIMVVSALAAALSGLAWLCVAGAGFKPIALMSGLVLAFGGLAMLNALRLPFQIWELQSSALMEERQRAFDRLNRENEERFREGL